MQENKLLREKVRNLLHLPCKETDPSSMKDQLIVHFDFSSIDTSSRKEMCHNYMLQSLLQAIGMLKAWR